MTLIWDPRTEYYEQLGSTCSVFVFILAASTTVTWSAVARMGDSVYNILGLRCIAGVVLPTQWAVHPQPIVARPIGLWRHESVDI
jgi:hypothetical protein